MWQVGVGLPTEQANASGLSVDPADGRGTHCKSWEKDGFWPMSHRNALDNSEVWPLNGFQLPARTSHGSGRVSDEHSFGPQTDLPCDGTSCGFDFGGSPCAVPAIFSQFEHPRLAIVVLGKPCCQRFRSEVIDSQSALRSVPADAVRRGGL